MSMSIEEVVKIHRISLLSFLSVMSNLVMASAEKYPEIIRKIKHDPKICDGSTLYVVRLSLDDPIKPAEFLVCHKHNGKVSSHRYCSLWLIPGCQHGVLLDPDNFAEFGLWFSGSPEFIKSNRVKGTEQANALYMSVVRSELQ